jgi:hypothetical protein
VRLGFATKRLREKRRASTFWKNCSNRLAGSKLRHQSSWASYVKAVHSTLQSKQGKWTAIAAADVVRQGPHHYKTMFVDVREIFLVLNDYVTQRLVHTQLGCFLAENSDDAGQLFDSLSS